MYAGSLFIEQLLGWNVYLSSILILLITAIYTIGGEPYVITSCTHVIVEGVHVVLLGMTSSS